MPTFLSFFILSSTICQGHSDISASLSGVGHCFLQASKSHPSIMSDMFLGVLAMVLNFVS